MRTRCKICGINTVEAALAAVAAGADALGFVFYEKSPRAVDSDKAASILRQCPPFISSVGLFVNPEIDVVKAVLSKVRLDILQFHGSESDAFCLQFGVPYIKALGVSPEFDIVTAETEYRNASALLLDTYDPVLHGGTGECFDWNRFPVQHSKPLILAGGLTPENVGKAIRQTRPYAVDVSGGVESRKGVKSTELIKSFVRGVINEHANGC